MATSNNEAPGAGGDSAPLLSSFAALTTEPAGAATGSGNTMSAATAPASFVNELPNPSAAGVGADVEAAQQQHEQEQAVMSEADMLKPLQLANMVKTKLRPMLVALGGVDGLGKKLGCADLVKGLPNDFNFEGNMARFGKNEFEPPPIPSYLYMIWEGLQDVIILMLVAAAIISFVLGFTVPNESYAWIEGVAITIAVLLVLNVQAATDYSKAITFRRQQLDLEANETIFVIRSGEIVKISPKQLVVGDVLKVDTGDVLTADGVIIEGKVKMDEAALTGESKLFEKRPMGLTAAGDKPADDEISPFCLSGTSVMDGRARVLVVAVGPNSVQGQILAAVSSQKEEKNNDEEDDKKKKKGADEKKNPALPHDEENPAVDSQPEISMDVHNTSLPQRSCSKRMCCCCRAFCPHGPRGFCEGFVNFWKAFFTFGKIDMGGTLMEKLDRVALDVGKLGLIVAFVVFVVLIIRWSVESFALNQPCVNFSGNLTQCILYTNAGCTNTSASFNTTCVRFFRGAADGQVILKFFIIAVTILVVAVPEGLPLAVTLALSVAMRRMWRDNNNVKIMEASETMGSATTICSDKTGTLTMNRMTTVRIAFVDGEGKPPAVYEPVTSADNSKSLGQVVNDAEQQPDQKARLEIFSDSVCLASEPTSFVTYDEEKKTYQYNGNATEAALLRLSHELGRPAEMVRPSFPPDAGSSLEWGIHNYPFSSSRKRMSWVVRLKSGGYRLFTKGAPSYVLDASTHYRGANGQTVPMTAEIRAGLDQVIDEFQHAAMRTIATAYRDFETIPDRGWDFTESQLDSATKVAENQCTFLAVVGIEDPLRPGVPEAIQKCHHAGVDVRMCTGDALATAIAISRQCGILRDVNMEKDSNGKLVPKTGFAMTGAEFDERVYKIDATKPLVLRRTYNPVTRDVVEGMAKPFAVNAENEKILDQKAFDEIWPKLRVLARCLPEDKLTLVRGLRRSKVFLMKDYRQELHDDFDISIFPDYQVVAVTGDGTNDAPALKAADVGFAMGIVGTKIAQRACDIILMDDNFASIVAAVKWGRNVFEAISKFIQFQLTVNLVAIVVASIGSFIYEASPLSAVQMLWVNMIMDSMASLALGLEPPGEELLFRPPYGKRRPMISRNMLTFIFGHGALQIAVIFGILFNSSWLPGNVPQFPAPGQDVHTAPDSVHWTMIFNTFVMMQLANELNARKLPTVERLKSTWWEWNVFTGLHRNPTFIVIILVTFGLQVIFVQLTGPVFKCVPLNADQWGFCIGWGLVEFPWQWVVNCMIIAQDKWCIKRKKGDDFEFEVEAEDHISPDEEEKLLGEGIVATGYEVGPMGEIRERPDTEVVPLNETRLQQAKQWMGSKRLSQIEEQKIQEFGRSFISRASIESGETSKLLDKRNTDELKKYYSQQGFSIDQIVKDAEIAEAERKAKEEEDLNRKKQAEVDMGPGTSSKEQ